MSDANYPLLTEEQARLSQLLAEAWQQAGQPKRSKAK